jgi:alginate O-acetyltransferase complex protein AlgI
MSFISFSFLFFFLLVLAGRVCLGPNKNEKSYLVMLLAASLVFYGSFVPWYLLLLLFTTIVDYYVGHKMAETTSPGYRKTYLVLSLVANLGLLVFFKYLNFLSGVSQLFLSLFRVHVAAPHWDIALPIGISFFTFQSMSYTIDIYRNKIRPEKTYWRFLLFVCFFTHLISGPIVRAKELLYQFDRKRKIRLKVYLEGFYLIVSGLFFKMVVADNIGDYVNKFWKYSAADNMAAAVPLSLTVLFSCQIFSDFLGYSQIAMGTAYLLGFKLPLNFNHPYIAGSFRDFWTRWHITLSTWIRDYLYIPLGGNQGSQLHVFSVLMLTMLLAGLWHGAALTFIFWGLIHGTALVFERILRSNRFFENNSMLLKVGWFVVVQTTVLISWIFFRSDNLGQAHRIFNNLFNGGFDPENALAILPGLWFVIPVFVLHGRAFLTEKGWAPKPGIVEKGFVCALMLYGIFTLYGKTNAFLYFQF